VQYEAHNIFRPFGCKAIDLCKDCRGPPCPEGKTCQDQCWAVDFRKYYASNYYGVSGATKIKTELVAHGPVACTMMVTNKFDAYTGGIYSEATPYVQSNHIISLIGYGKDAETGEEYWIGRNSWGTYWGEGGFFRMLMYKNNLGIEDSCAAAIPTFKSLEEREQLDS